MSCPHTKASRHAYTRCAAVLLLLLATNANAGTVEIIFTSGCEVGNGTANCTARIGEIVTTAVHLTTAVGDTPLGGGGFDTSYSFDVIFFTGALYPLPPASNTPPPGWTPGSPGVLTGNVYADMVTGSDVIGLNPLVVPATYSLGSVSVLVDASGGVIFSNPTVLGQQDLTSEYSLSDGLVTALPSLTKLNDMTVAYDEDFAGEVGLPTTPELDLLPAGSIGTYQVGNGPPSEPVIVGGVNFTVVPVDGPEGRELQGIAVVPAAIAANRDVAVRATFDSASSTQIAPYALQQNVLLALDADGLFASVDFALFASLVSVDFGAGPTVEFHLTRFDTSTGTSTTLDVATVPAFILTELSNGDTFEVTLLLDRSLDEATARLKTSSELLLYGTALMQGQQTVSANVETIVLNAISGVGSTGEDDSNAVSLRRLELLLDSLPIPVPVPALHPLAAVALVALLASIGIWASARTRARNRRLSEYFGTTAP